MLAQAGQWIPLDPPHAARATVGGIVASNDSGPRRFGFGAPRDSIIGIEVALTTGSVAHAGGRVVKNVAGYDLGRLFCGSRGALGLITAVTFKLAPRAAASRTVVAQYERPEQAQAAALEIARSPSLTPTTIEFISPPARLLVRFETTNRAAESMAGAAARVLSTEGAGVAILGGDEESAVWAAHQAIESRADGLEVSAAVLPASGATLLQQMDPVSTACDVSVAVTGRAALGLFRIRFTGTPDALARAATMTGDVATRLQGHARITAGDTSADARAMPPADAGPAAAVAYAVKQRFDPAGVLPWPWRGASAETAHT